MFTHDFHLIINYDLDTIQIVWATSVRLCYILKYFFGHLLTQFLVVDVFKLETCRQTWWFVRLPPAFIDQRDTFETSLNTSISIRIIQPSQLLCTPHAMYKSSGASSAYSVRKS